MLQKIAAAVKTKVFIINAVVIGVIALAAASLPVIMSDAGADPNAKNRRDSGLIYTRLSDQGTFNCVWEISVAGDDPVSWAEIYKDQDNLKIVINSRTDKASDLIITEAGLAFAKDGGDGMGTFTATVYYGGYSKQINN